MIDVQNVSKAYGTTKVLENVSVQIPRGGITSIIGPNGAGKSTLLSIISRLLKPDSGLVTVDGFDVNATSSDTLAKKIAVLRQNNHLTVRLTVEDLVAFGRYPHSKGRPTVDDQEHIESALDFLELQELRHRYLDELSGGQRQRAFVAMVLAQDTDYLLLDEPLNNLDMKHSVSMMKRLRRITDELDKTVVLVVHDINFASCYSDGIIALRDGSLVEHAGPLEVMQSAVLRNIYDMDVDVQEIGGIPIGIYFR